MWKKKTIAMKFLAPSRPINQLFLSSSLTVWILASSLIFLDADNKKDGENSKDAVDANDKNGKAAGPEPKRNKRRLVLEVGRIAHLD